MADLLGMPLLYALLLGTVQGVTEFLPVSSSGHLVLAERLLPGFRAAPAAFEALLHAGTLLAVVVYFRGDLARLTAGLARPRQGGWRLPALLLLGSVPAGAVGLLFRHEVESLFTSPRTAAAGLVVTGFLLLAAARWGRGGKGLADLRWPHALAIGLFQALAIVPGISRSGATIACALILGFSGTESARFSFLLSLPAVAGAVLLEAKAIAGDAGFGLHLLGALAAAAVGWFSIRLLLTLLAERKLLPFALYCLGLGVIALALLG